MAFDTWPICALMPTDVRFSPTSGSARFGGRTLNGSVRMTTWSAGGLWRATYQKIWAWTSDEILVAEAIEAILDGGAEPMAIPRLPGLRAPSLVSDPVTHSDGTAFSDGTLYAGAGIPGVVTAGVSLFSTELSFTWSGLVHLLGGDFEVMAPEGPRLHRIKRFRSRTGEPGSYAYTVEITPPLRCDVEAGAELDFTTPRCLMRLANPEAFAPLLEMNRWGFIDAEFVEA